MKTQINSEKKSKKPKSIPTTNDKYIFRALYLSLPGNMKNAFLVYFMDLFGYNDISRVYRLLRFQKNQPGDLTPFQFLSLCKFFDVEPLQAICYELPEATLREGFLEKLSGSELVA